MGLLVAACATLWVHGRIDTASAAASGRLHLPSPERARALSLGFEPVLADYYWIQAIQLVGGAEDARDTHGDLVGDLIELVTTLDPWVDHPYRFAGLWLTASADDVRRGNALLEKGISYHPLEWRNRFYLGYNLFFYLEDNARAADVLETALPLEGAPSYLGPFVTRLRASTDGLETAELFLEHLIREAPDQTARAQYLRAFDEIETERRARFLDRARMEFWNRHGRDIREPAELWSGPLRVIEKWPPAHPRYAGFDWVIDEETGEIVSSYYGKRYRVHVHPGDVERRRKWREERRRVQAERAASPEDSQRAGGAPAEGSG